MATQSKTFCPLPFIHSHASVSGKFKPCCNSLSGSWENTIRDMSYQEWFDSDIMTQLRSDLLSGVQNKLCDVCWKDEKVTSSSIRQRYIEKFSNIVDVKNPKIKYLDLKLSNECNLKCRMCSYISSHLIGNDMQQLENSNSYMPRHWLRSPTAEKNMDQNSIQQVSENEYNEILNLLPQIKQLKVTGGEPTISKKFIDILDECNSKNYSQNINLSITTNATKFTSNFLSKLDDFASVHLNISCDGYNSTYNYIRYPFNWDKFQERIQNLKDYSKNNNISLGLQVVPLAINVENLPALQKWSKNFIETTKNTWPPFMNTFVKPDDSFLSLENVPTHILQYAYDNLIEVSENSGLIKRIKNLIDNPVVIDKEKEIDIVKSIQSVDQIRSQHYADYLEPMTAEWLEGLFKKHA